jgi:molybdopterin synthase sulfur carrier subunit
MIRILYFASLRERLGSSGENMEAFPATLDELRRRLADRGGVWQETFAGDQRVLAAVNQEMAPTDRALEGGDEVGFFPPVTGG